MTSRSKTEIKSFFETDDRPTEAQFADLIDSYVDKSGPIGTWETAASGLSTGFAVLNAGTPSIAGYSSVLPNMGITVYTTALAVAAITSADSNTWYGQQSYTNSVFFTGRTLFPDDGRRFISGGLISLTGTTNTLEAQSSAATDDLDGITTTGSGLFWMLRAESDDRTIVMRHNQSVSAAIFVPNGLNITLDTNKRYVGGIYDSDLDKHVVLFDGTTKEYVDAAKDTNFTSSDQTITAAGQIVLAHGLGGIPDQVNYFLVCQTGEGGYTAGDIVPTDICNSTSGNNSYNSPVADATNVTIRYSDDPAVFYIGNKTTGAVFGINPANWLLRVKARKWA
jgi:hypothetical protein